MANNNLKYVWYMNIEYCYYADDVIEEYDNGKPKVAAGCAVSGGYVQIEFNEDGSVNNVY